MKNHIKLSPRLMAAAAMVRQNVFVADIGTDHAYLPIFLCLTEKVKGAVASDINAGPVERARKNIYDFGLDEKISVLHTDGLCGIQEYSPDEIMILGMGGELIARILADADWTKNSRIRLCLQPMTHPEAVRKFLIENGYSIIDEDIVVDDKIYQIIYAGFTGEADAYSPAELYFGKINIARKSESFFKLAEQQLKVLQKRAEGKRAAGEDTCGERELIDEISKIIGEAL